MDEDYSGFSQGKGYLKARKQLKGIEGAVAELIEVGKQYEMAIDVALVRLNILLFRLKNMPETRLNIKSCSAGRATFLPLSVIEPRQIPYEVAAKNKNTFLCGTASELA